MKPTGGPPWTLLSSHVYTEATLWSCLVCGRVGGSTSLRVETTSGGTLGTQSWIWKKNSWEVLDVKSYIIYMYMIYIDMIWYIYNIYIVYFLLIFMSCKYFFHLYYHCWIVHFTVDLGFTEMMSTVYPKKSGKGDVEVEIQVWRPHTSFGAPKS